MQRLVARAALLKARLALLEEVGVGARLLEHTLHALVGGPLQEVPLLARLVLGPASPLEVELEVPLREEVQQVVDHTGDVVRVHQRKVEGEDPPLVVGLQDAEAVVGHRGGCAQHVLDGLLRGAPLAQGAVERVALHALPVVDRETLLRVADEQHYLLHLVLHGEVQGRVRAQLRVARHRLRLVLELHHVRLEAVRVAREEDDQTLKEVGPQVEVRFLILVSTRLVQLLAHAEHLRLRHLLLAPRDVLSLLARLHDDGEEEAERVVAVADGRHPVRQVVQRLVVRDLRHQALLELQDARVPQLPEAARVVHLDGLVLVHRVRLAQSRAHLVEDLLGLVARDGLEREVRDGRPHHLAVLLHLARLRLRVAEEPRRLLQRRRHFCADGGPHLADELALRAFVEAGAARALAAAPVVSLVAGEGAGLRVGAFAVDEDVDLVESERLCAVVLDRHRRRHRRPLQCLAQQALRVRLRRLRLRHRKLQLTDLVAVVVQAAAHALQRRLLLHHGVRRPGTLLVQDVLLQAQGLGLRRRVRQLHPHRLEVLLLLLHEARRARHAAHVVVLERLRLRRGAGGDTPRGRRVVLVGVVLLRRRPLRRRGEVLLRVADVRVHRAVKHVAGVAGAAAAEECVAAAVHHRALRLRGGLGGAERRGDAGEGVGGGVACLGEACRQRVARHLVQTRRAAGGWAEAGRSRLLPEGRRDVMEAARPGVVHCCVARRTSLLLWAMKYRYCS
eukprot:Rhum_TRINITY_DN14269_c1_g1::Rhum_TRINITY_DN14269_c1_g1_i1::g.78502::m.78502